MKSKKNICLHKKQCNRFWCQYIFDIWLFDRNRRTGSNNISIRKVNVKQHGLNKMYMDRDLIKDILYQVIDQFNESKITPLKFYSTLLNEINPFYDGNSRTCKILFGQEFKTINLLIRQKPKINNINFIFIILNA